MQDHALLAAAVNFAIDSVIVTTHDPNDPRIVYVNPAFTRITGYEAQEVLGKNPRFLQGPRTDRGVIDRLKAALHGDQIFYGEAINYRKDGKEFINDWHIEPIRGPDGTPTHFLAIQRDVTERRFMQQQLQQAQKLESMGLMASGIAHDFNNILTVVKGYGELASLRIPVDAPGYSEVQKIIVAAAKGSALTTRLLRYNRKQSQERTRVRVDLIIVDIEKLLSRVFPKSITFKLNLDSSVPEILADPGQLEQLLMNAAINARDAMEKGGTLTLSTSTQILEKPQSTFGLDLAPGSYVRIDVADTGSGMSPAIMETLFEPFFTTKEIGKGTGLGLSIIKAILRDHHAGVIVKSEAGVGTCFGFLFPC